MDADQFSTDGIYLQYLFSIPCLLVQKAQKDKAWVNDRQVIGNC